MDKIIDGGPAFPVPADNWLGLSLRDYFIAHAPAEPQSWFEPAMPQHPAKPDFPKDAGTEQQRSYVREFDSVMDPDEADCPELRAYVEAVQAYEPRAAEWKREARKQRYVQWPAAWADAMLKERSE